MGLVFIFAVVFFEVVLIDFLKVMEVVWAFGVHAFMDGKALAAFLGYERMAAMGAAQLHGREAAFLRGEPCGADFAQELSF